MDALRQKFQIVDKQNFQDSRGEVEKCCVVNVFSRIFNLNYHNVLSGIESIDNIKIVVVTDI